jgi:hypothetical protein
MMLPSAYIDLVIRRVLYVAKDTGFYESDKKILLARRKIYICYMGRKMMEGVVVQ